MNSDANHDLTPLSPLFRAPGTGPTLDVLGVTHSYKVMASDTDRQFSVWESIVPPGCGAPAHTHTREDEAFYVLSGEVLVEVEGTADPLRSVLAHFSLRRATSATAIATSAPIRRASRCSRCRAKAWIACSSPSTRRGNVADIRRLSRLLLQLPSSTVSLFIRRLAERTKGASLQMSAISI